MGVKTYDFAIGYENKVREIESVLLLKYELERRGHSVFIFQEFDQRYDNVVDVMYHAKVLILSCAYNDKFVEKFCRRFLTFDKLVNWQWEQVFGKSWESDPKSACGVQGYICCQAVHMSWGSRNRDRLTRIIGLPEEKVFVTGSIAMDFLKPQFRDFYLSREELFNIYNIPTDKKVAVLMGAFSRAFRTKEELDALAEETGRDVHAEARLNRGRFDRVMEWISKALKENEDLFFVYRPHPGEEYERCNQETKDFLDKMHEETGRFITLQELPARQWIVTCDKIYMGFSTTAVDAYFAGKGCYIIAPGGASSDTTALFDGADVIDDCDSFLESIKSDDFNEPLAHEMLSQYYEVNDKMAYQTIADLMEKVLKEDKFLVDAKAMFDKINSDKEAEMKAKSKAKRIKLSLWKYEWFYNLYWKVMFLPINAKYFQEQRKYKARIDEYYKGYVSSKEEINEIWSRIKKCLG